MDAAAAPEHVVVAAETEEKPVKAVRIPTPEKDDANELLRLRADCARDVERACSSLRSTFEQRFAKEKAAHDRRWAETERKMRDDLETALQEASKRADDRYASEAARFELRRRASLRSTAPQESDLEATKAELDLAYATFEPTLEAQREAQKQLVAARKAAVEASKTNESIPIKVMGCVEIKILRRVRAESSRRPPRHRRDACSTPARWRGDAGSSPLDGASTAVHPTHWLISTQVMGQLDVRRLTARGMTMLQISELQERLRCHEFQPTRVVVDEHGEAKDVVDRDDPELVALRVEFGDVAVDEVVRCFRELDAWNPSGRYSVSVPWDPAENQEMAPAQVIDRLAAPRRPSVQERTAAFISGRRAQQAPPPPARLHNRTQSSRAAAGGARQRSHSGLSERAAGLRQFFGWPESRGRTGSA